MIFVFFLLFLLLFAFFKFFESFLLFELASSFQSRFFIFFFDQFLSCFLCFAFSFFCFFIIFRFPIRIPILTRCQIDFRLLQYSLVPLLLLLLHSSRVIELIFILIFVSARSLLFLQIAFGVTFMFLFPISATRKPSLPLHFLFHAFVTVHSCVFISASFDNNFPIMMMILNQSS